MLRTRISSSSNSRLGLAVNLKTYEGWRSNLMYKTISNLLLGMWYILKSSLGWELPFLAENEASILRKSLTGCKSEPTHEQLSFHPNNHIQTLIILKILTKLSNSLWQTGFSYPIYLILLPTPIKSFKHKKQKKKNFPAIHPPKNDKWSSYSLLK